MKGSLPKAMTGASGKSPNQKPSASAQSEEVKPSIARDSRPKNAKKGQPGNAIQYVPITPWATSTWVASGRLVMELVNNRMAYYFVADDGRVIGVYPGVWSFPPMFQWSSNKKVASC
ncbi:hypothetical protein CGMCC3_g12965 [Colletotrichum fructicola]|uniref:Uncharacterized protein n=1 Tax=Colletotrichum fructicola (strain Nara gc5) TaxID=1213859 RepID=A0A7J6JB92_COLFN|nr:uncharacterized protein CGMCC3_g12965 [Colletotrichum fructicola]KAF4475049.1 hypothetical protein CGGC5_v015977 [Colletotrichum fructicola Nara gc5]KAE9570950.1 hypothetical protein CGMCC3_g12965 [Colletotrichum fructicola]KAF4419011.1 hypothetical protein CFRS1_v015688 [Colletotrichum fructicola]KAF4486035.1 hypothetical protein CGGC5_v005844 [Colletotrichum fructicola Nara gc5]KAF4881772.1 hypothetical protein CGCFRS4_v015225 [Colletotrichum fructicola]